MLEWTFQVALPADEFGREATAGQLHGLVLRQLDRAWETDDDSTCSSLSARVSQRLGAAMQDLFSVSPGLASPSAKIDTLVPARRRRQAWWRLGEALDLRLPDLDVAPKAARTKNHLALAALAVFMASVLLFGCVVAIESLKGSAALREGLASLAAAGFIAATVMFCASLLGTKTHVPPCCRTVGDMVLTLARLNPIRLGPGRLTYDEVWQMLQWTVAEEIGIAPETVTRDLRIADALASPRPG